jgi:hypothetical protein
MTAELGAGDPLLSDHRASGLTLWAHVCAAG